MSFVIRRSNGGAGFLVAAAFFAGFVAVAQQPLPSANRSKATVRIGATQPRTRLIDGQLTNTAEVLAAVDQSLAALVELVGRAAAAGCDAVALPEDTLGLGRWEAGQPNLWSVVLPAAVDRMVDRLGRAAARHHLYVVCCNDTLSAAGALRNTAFFLGRDGHLLGHYDKVNMPIHELNKERGTNFPVFATSDLGVVGMLICYDMVFPEAARCLALAGADIIFHPTLGGAAIGDDELSRAAFRTRAVENFVYLVVAQRGAGAMIISPQGQILAEGKGEIVMADINPFAGREGGDAMNTQADMRARLFRERSPAAFSLLTDSNPPVLQNVPESMSIAEAVQISGKTLTRGDQRFKEADALLRAGETNRAVAAFQELRREFRQTWIDRVAGERLARLAAPEPASSTTPPSQPAPARGAPVFIDTSFENASPLWSESLPDGTVLIHLLYDQERFSPNRAAGHIHFCIDAAPGAHLQLEFTNLSNVWNGTPGSVAKELRTVVVSENGVNWRPVPTEVLSGERVRLALEMPGPKLYVARVEPYRLSDLDRWLAKIRGRDLVQITPIGQTVQGRALEIVRIGKPGAPHRVFLRARAHPWEPVGNWVVEGLTDRLLDGSADARRFLETYCVYVMPMANKDGVVRGMTRFNASGKDLNRHWDKPADAELMPENAALEKWLEKMIQNGERPDLALELHNDGGGLLHVSRPPAADLTRYLQRMELLENLLRGHTWFTEGSTKAAFHNSGTLGEGWLERYGIDAAVHEFNCNWIAGLNDYPSARHWRQYGSDLATVFSEYFSRRD